MLGAKLFRIGAVLCGSIGIGLMILCGTLFPLNDLLVSGASLCVMAMIMLMLGYWVDSRALSNKRKQTSMADTKTANFITAVEDLKHSIVRQSEINEGLVHTTETLYQVIEGMAPDDAKRKILESVVEKILSASQELSANTVSTSGAAATVITTGTSGRR